MNNWVWNCSPGIQEKRESDMTLEDMYNARYNFDEHDDNCYWEPSEMQIEVLKWFCTMINVKDVGNCEVCKEHRESGVLRHGFLASPYLPVEDVSQDELPVTENSEASTSTMVEISFMWRLLCMDCL